MRGIIQPAIVFLVIILLIGIFIGVQPIREKVLGTKGNVPIIDEIKTIPINIPYLNNPTPTPEVLISPTPSPTSSQSPGTPASTPTPTPAPTPTQNPQTTPTPTPQATKNDRYGVNTGILVTEEPYFNSALDYAGILGVGWIRLSNDWVDLEPKDNQWNFSTSDTYINTAKALGLKVLYTFDPDLNGKFCTMSPIEVSQGRTKCTDEQFKDYISQIVTRYKGKVSYYELGNEPDLRPRWRDYPSEYARALALAYPTVKAADPNSRLLLGGLALGGGQSSSVKWVQDFLNDKNNPPFNNFDIMNYHTYDKKDGITKQFNDVKSKVGNKPIWVTEVGYPSEPSHQQNNRSTYPYPAGEDGQEGYLKDILPHILSLGAEKVFYYTLVDVPRDGGGGGTFCSYGLLYIPEKQCLGDSAGRTTGGELQTKKAFDTYKSLTQ